MSGPAPDGRGSRRSGRWAVLAVAAAFAAAFAWSELRTAAELSGADDPRPAAERDAEAARADLSARLLELERTGADVASLALERTADISDRAELFAALDSIPLPPGAGVQVEDRERRVLAWNGTSIDEETLRAIPFAGDGAVVVWTPASRRLATRRTKTTSREGVPARAICHLPVEVRYPLRNRYFAAWSLTDEVRSRHRVDACEILPVDDVRGTPLGSAYGGTFVRVAMEPLEPRAWREAVEAERSSRRGVLLHVGAVLAAGIAFLRLRPSRTRRPAVAALLRAGVAVALRAALAFVPAADVLPRSPATDSHRYAHGLPLAFASSPADLLLTCLAALAAAACVRRAAQAARVGSRSPWLGAAAALGTAVLVSAALGSLVEDTVRNSTVEFFSDVSVLPFPASATLLAALLAAGIAGVLLVSAAWTWLGPRETPGVPARVALTLLAAVAAAPWGPALSASDAALRTAGTLGCALSLACLLFDAGTAARAALVPLGVAAAMFAPLEASVAGATQRAVLRAAEDRVADADAAARFLVEATLDRLAESADLARALREARMPRDLQLRLWAESPLASRLGGSGIEVEPLDATMERVRFAVNLPPVPWLPGTAAWPPLDSVSGPLAGRGPGRDGRWIVGSRRIVVDGRHAANAWVFLEVRPPPNPGLPELDILGPAPETDTLRTPECAVAAYDAGGNPDPAEGGETHAGAGGPLPAAVREEAAAKGAAWSTVRAPDGERTVVVVPRRDGETVVGFASFAYSTGGVTRLALRGGRAALCGAVLGALALALTFRRWLPGPRLGLAPRLVLSYVVVSGLPLLLLGWANRELALRRANETAVRELREAAALLVAYVEEPGTELPLRLLQQPQAIRDERLREYAYGMGHHANVFHGPELLASTDQGLFDTELLPRRLPGQVQREILLRGRPFLSLPARVGGETFDVGYAPVRAQDGAVVGAVSVPLLHQRRLRDTDVADGVTAILALYLASLGVAAAVFTWLAGRLTRPLRDLTTATRRVASGDLSRPVPGEGPGELGEVVGAFNRMMRDLAESRERLVRAEKEAAWRDMARQVAHEVKNPLTPMRLAAEHIRRAWRDRVPDFDDVLQRGVDLIVRQTESLQRIATAFSDFARLPGRRRLPTDVGEVVRQVAALYAPSPGLTVRADVEPGLPRVSADPDELERVLVNLAKNAAEAVGGRGGTVTLRLRRADGGLLLQVEDDGPGIPPDVLPRLFEPYFSTKTSGTGLGLAICKRAVDDLGGTIGVESADGRGTVVSVRLPAGEAQGPSVRA